MDEIPEDIRKAAQAVYEGMFVFPLSSEFIAAALMAERVSATAAERERCATKALNEAENVMLDDPAFRACLRIAAAIREGTP